MLTKNEGLIGYRFEGTRHDAGDKLGNMKANIANALKRPRVARRLDAMHGIFYHRGEKEMKSALLALLLVYVMPAGPVLRRLAAVRDDMTLTRLKIDGPASVSPAAAKYVSNALAASWNSGELSLNASIAVRFPFRRRLDIASPESNKTHTFACASGKKRTDGFLLRGSPRGRRLILPIACNSLGH